MMRAPDLVSSAFRSLRANPMRSILTALGVIIGVASVIGMTSMAAGASAKTQASIKSLGSNLLIIVPGATRGQGNVVFTPSAFLSLSLGDAAAIEKEIPGLAIVAPSQRAGGQIVAGGTNWNTRIEGVTPSYLAARDWTVQSGRMFDDREARQGKAIVVLGATVADNLFPSSNPVGQRVRINQGAYEVVGVLAKKGQSATGADQDDTLLAPFTTVKRRIAGRFGGRPDTVSTIYVKTERASDLDDAQEQIETLLRQRHKIAPGGTDDFTIQNLASIADTLKQVTGTFTVLLGAISGVSLIVGGIGIMNIMLVSVTERTREIGLRKALGARRGDVLNQFALEAIVLSSAGGVFGLGFGMLIAWGLTSLLQFPLIFSPLNAMTAIGVSAIVGVIFGAYPAWQAAKLDPIEALRRE